MKSFLKRSARALLRPLVHRIDGRITRLVEAAVRPLVIAELELRVTPVLDATRATVWQSCDRTEEIVAYLRRSAQENTLLLDSLLRELVRLQMQLEACTPLGLTEAETGAGAEEDPAETAEPLMIGGPAGR